MNFRCKTILAVSLALLLTALSADAAKPSEAMIVDVPAERGDYGIPIGNVKVIFDDGHSEMWTKKGRCMLLKVSASGIVGWSFYTSRNSYKEPVNDKLRILLSEKDIRDFQGGPFIEDWWFTDGDTSIVIKSRERHGPAFYAKYDLKTSKCLGTASARHDPELPEWAKPYAD